MMHSVFYRTGRLWSVRALLAAALLIGVAGCGSWRPAPSESLKQNAWLHQRTAQAAAETAVVEAASAPLQSLTQLSQLQSRALAAYCGPPTEYPAAATTEQLLAPSSWQLAETALVESTQRPGPWDVTDMLLEIGIGVSALLGGVYGVRIASLLKAARAKSQALREIVAGNERFKQQHADQAAPFKAAQADQSPETRRLVAELKN